MKNQSGFPGDRSGPSKSSGLRAIALASKRSTVAVAPAKCCMHGHLPVFVRQHVVAKNLQNKTAIFF